MPCAFSSEATCPARSSACSAVSPHTCTLLCASAKGRSARSRCITSRSTNAWSTSGSVRPAKGFLVTISVSRAPMPFCLVRQRLRNSPTSARRPSAPRPCRVVHQRASKSSSCKHLAGQRGRGARIADLDGAEVAVLDPQRHVAVPVAAGQLRRQGADRPGLQLGLEGDAALQVGGQRVAGQPVATLDVCLSCWIRASCAP